MRIKKIKITVMNLEDSFKESKKIAAEIDKGIFKRFATIDDLRKEIENV